MEQVERVLQLVRETLAVPPDGDARVSFFLHGLKEVLELEGAALVRCRPTAHNGSAMAVSTAIGRVSSVITRQAGQIIRSQPAGNGNRGAHSEMRSQAHAALSIWQEPTSGSDRQGLLIIRSCDQPAFADQDRELLTAIHAQCYFLLVSSEPEPIRLLTPRQREIAQLLGEGLTEPAIADRLCISPHTVHSHVKSIYASLNVSSRAELIVKLSGAQGPQFDVGL